jgi:hypothetical protein
MANDDLNQSETTDLKKVCSERWQLKKNPRQLKQLPGIEPCQCRKARIQKNHIACATLLGSFIHKNSAFNGENYLPFKE